MEQVSKVQTLKEDVRVVHGASKGCGIICLVLVILPFLAEASGWMPIKSLSDVWGGCFLVCLFLTVLITTYLEYSLQPALDRAQNQLILNSRQQIAELSRHRDAAINAVTTNRVSQVDNPAIQLELEINRLEQRARLVNRFGWVTGLLALALPWLIALILISIRHLNQPAIFIGLMPAWICTLSTVVLFVIHQYSCKPAIARAKSELITELQRQLAELQVVLNGN